MMKKTSEMTLTEKVGQVIVMGGAVGGLGDARPDACLEYALGLIDEHKIGTFYLGYPRYDNPMEAYKLNVRLQEASEIPLLLAADMETALGYVVIDGVQRQPYPMGMGAAGDEDLARECGAIVAREARAVGFNWNLGPVVDVNILKDNPGVGIRSFGDDPELVSRLGAAYIAGCQSEGVVCSAKHFPGHGSKSVDTHDDIGVDDSSLDSMMRINLPPFRAAIRAGVKSVMSNHIVFPAFGDDRFPATLSKNVMTDLLRGDLGFEGLAVSDSMSMNAISDNFGEREAIIESFLAGCDTIIAPPEWRIWETLTEAVQSGRIPMSRLDEAVDRVLAVKRWVFPDGYHEPKAEDVAPVFESAQTAKTLETLALKSTTIIEGKALPLTPGAKKRLIIIQERDETYQYCVWEKGILDKAERTLRETEPEAAVMRISMACSDDEARAVRQAAADCDEVIFFCIAKHLIEQYDGRLSRASAELLSGISRERRVIGVCLGSPYVIEDIADCVGFICTYSESDISAETALRVLYGEIVPEGKLPVTISEKYPFGTGWQG